MRITAWRDRVGDATRHLVNHERFNALLVGLMVVGIAGILVELGLIVFLPEAGGSSGRQFRAIDVAAIASTALSAPYTSYGLYRLIRGDRAGALRVMFRAALVSVLFTQVFVFFRYQLTGVIGVAYALVILSGLRILAESVSSVYRSPAPNRLAP